MKGKLAIFSLFIVTLLSSCSNNTYKSSENTCHLYRTKINNVSQDENGNWVIKGVTVAPNGAKILVSNRVIRIVFNTEKMGLNLFLKKLSLKLKIKNLNVL